MRGGGGGGGGGARGEGGASTEAKEEPSFSFICWGEIKLHRSDKERMVEDEVESRCSSLSGLSCCTGRAPGVYISSSP